MLRKGPPRGMPRPRGPPPADLLAKAKKQQQRQQPPKMPSSEQSPNHSSVVVENNDPEQIVKKIPKGKKKIQGYVRSIGAELIATKAAHDSMQEEMKKIKRERDELKEDFDALNDDFQNVRHDVAKAEKKAKDHLDNVKEMHSDNKDILDSNDALRTLATIAFKGLIDIESTLVIATKLNKSTGANINISKKEKDQLIKDSSMNVFESLNNLRNLKIKLRESLLAMSVDIFSQEEKDMMELVKNAGDDAGKAATTLQSQFRGKQARAEFQEKKEAATKVQSQIRGVQARKQTNATAVGKKGTKINTKITNSEKAGDVIKNNSRQNDKLKQNIIQLEKQLKER
jgi:hypothetical protein